MPTVTTIEQFQSMMKSEQKSELLRLMELITTSTTPTDVRRMSDKIGTGGQGSWAGWR